MEIKQFPKITVILRGYTYEQVRCVVKNLVGTRLNAVEITTNSPDVFTTIRKISEEFGKDVYVGAGTVLNMEHAKAAVEAGSTFLLSPIMLDQEILDFCKEKGVISVPAAFSPSEVWKMAQGGADIVKIFPAGRVGSQYFADVQAPLGKLPLMAVGGVNGEDVQEYLDKGASFAGIASGIFKKEDILNQNEEGIRESIRQFEERVQW